MSPKWTSCQKTESEKNDITFHKNKIPKKECCICNIKQTEYKEWVKVKHNYIIIIIIIICSYVVEGSEQLHVSAIAAIIRLYIAWERSWVQYATTVKIKITKITKILYFVDRASLYKFLEITNLRHFFMYEYIFISCLYMFRASQRSSTGDRILLIHHLIWLVCVSDCLVCLTGIPRSHWHRLLIPDDVLIKFDLLLMGAVTLEICRDMK